MKKGVMFLFLVLISFSFISAVSAVDVSCSDGGNVSSDFKEVDIGEKKAINGLGIGVISADEVAVMNRFLAEIIIDAGKSTVSNSTYLDYVDLSDGQHTITFINATGENAFIDIDGSTGSLNLGDKATIGSFSVFLSEITGDSANPGVKILMGKSTASLSNYENPADKVTTSKGDYVVELYSASDGSATLKVYSCDAGNINIVGEEEPEEEEEENTEVTSDATPPIIDSKIEQLLNNVTETPVIVIIKDKGNESLHEKIIVDLIIELGDNIVLEDKEDRSFSGNITKEGFDAIKGDINILSIRSTLKENNVEEIQEKAGIFSRFWGWFKKIFSKN